MAMAHGPVSVRSSVSVRRGRLAFGNLYDGRTNVVVTVPADPERALGEWQAGGRLCGLAMARAAAGRPVGKAWSDREGGV